MENKFGMQTDIVSLYLYALNGTESAAIVKPIMDCNGVDKLVRKSRFVYGEGDVKMYCMNFDAAIEDPI
jgi:hypothetical protein